MNSTRAIGNGTTLSQWAQTTIGSEMGKVKVRLRGNTLHILCESAPHAPAQELVESRLVEGLLTTDLESLLPDDGTLIYQIWLYGRVSGPNYPDWTKEIDLTTLLDRAQQTGNAQELEAQTDRQRILEEGSKPADGDREVGDQSLSPSPVAIADRLETNSTLARLVSNRNLASEGNPQAIARYLSETLSPLGIGVKVKIKTLKRHPDKNSTDPTDPTDSTVKRLHVGCYSNYSPDPSLLGPKIAGQLRELELGGFRDAAIASQVYGESSPDWVLLVDLTPRSVMLDRWARWGDVPAINRLLDRELAHETLNISTILKESTLHLFCRGTTIPDQKNVTGRIYTLLKAIAPQGIHAITIYGHLNSQSTPTWVDWLDLPAKSNRDLGPSTLSLAKQGHQVALQFLLNRLLNPDIDQQLSTGGIRIQLFLKNDLLHVMSDAPVCPNQGQVGPLVAKFLRQLKIPKMAGVRVYGRRAGQKLPRWNYGVDFQSRKRLVPQAPPEFAASSVYVGDLIALDRHPPDLPQDLPQDLTHNLETPAESLTPRQKEQRTEISSEDPGQVTAAIEDADSTLEHQLEHQEVSKPSVTQDSVPTRPRRSLLHHAQRFLVSMGLLTPTASASPVGTRGDLLSSSSPSLSIGALSATALFSSTTSVNPSEVGEKRTIGQGRWQVTPQLLIALVWGALGLLLTVEIDWFLGYQLRQIGSQREQLFADEVQPTSGYLKLGGDPANASDESLVGSVSVDAEGCTDPDCLLSPPSPYPSFNNQLIDEHLGRYHALMLESGAPDILIIGSSRALRGIDPQRLREGLERQGYGDVEIYNFGINGATAKVVDWVIRELLTPEQLPKVIIWADGTRAFNSGREDLTYEAIAASPGYQELREQTLTRPTYGTPWLAAQGSISAEDKDSKGKFQTFSITKSYEQANDWLEDNLGTFSAVYPQRDRLHLTIQNTLSTLLPEDPAQLSGTGEDAMLQPAILNSDGFLPFKIRFDPDTYYEHHPQVSGAYDRDYESFSLEGEQHQSLENSIAYTQDRGVSLVFVNLPLTDVYLDPIRTEYELEFRDYLTGKEEPDFMVRDWVELWSGGEYEYFSDPSHLNRYGAEAIATQLAEDSAMAWDEVLKRDN